MRSLEAGKPCSQAWQRIPSDPNEMECVNVRSLKHRRLNFELQKAEEIGSHIAHENSKIQKIPLLWFRMILPILPSVEVSILYVESNFRHPWLRGKTKKEMCVQLNKTCRTCHRWPKKWVTGVKTKTIKNPLSGVISLLLGGWLGPILWVTWLQSFLFQGSKSPKFCSHRWDWKWQDYSGQELLWFFENLWNCISPLVREIAVNILLGQVSLVCQVPQFLLAAEVGSGKIVRVFRVSVVAVDISTDAWMTNF